MRLSQSFRPVSAAHLGNASRGCISQAAGRRFLDIEGTWAPGKMKRKHELLSGVHKNSTGEVPEYGVKDLRLLADSLPWMRFGRNKMLVVWVACWFI